MNNQNSRDLRSTPLAIDELFAPLGVATFLSEYLEQGKVLHLKGPKARFSTVFELNEIEEVLSKASASCPDSVILRQNGTLITRDAYMRNRGRHSDLHPSRIDPEVLTSHLSAGATLVINNVDTLSYRLQSFARELERHIRRKAWINLYAVWQATPGGLAHYDDHDVLALQIVGRKNWRLASPTTPDALTKPATAESMPAVFGTEQEISEGEILFVPRGWWHQPVATALPSVHLTIGFESVTGSALIRWLAGELEHSRVMRKTIPWFSGPEATRKHLELVSRVIGEAMRDPLTIRYFLGRSTVTELFVPAFGGSAEASFQWDATSYVRCALPADPDIVLVDGGEWLELLFAGSAYRYDSRMEQIIRRLCRVCPCTVGRLQSAMSDVLGQDELMRFLEDLYRRGIVAI